jgi:hypothetical protein
MLYRIAPDAGTPDSSSSDSTKPATTTTAKRVTSTPDTDTQHSSTPAASSRSSTTTASTTTPGSPQVITPAQAWQQAVNRAVGDEPHTTVVPGDTLTAISNLSDKCLLGVENDNPQIPNKNLIFPGERVNLSKPNPDPEVVPPIGNKQIQPIIDQYAYAQTTQNLADAHPQAFSPTDRGQIWNGVTQFTYNMLMGDNKTPYPDVAGVAEVKTLDSLEPGNTDFAAANATALKEADAQWTKMGVTKVQLSPIVTAYNQYKQTVASANQYLDDPRLPHNMAIVQGVREGEGEAKTNLYNAIDASLMKAAGTTESKGGWAAFFNDVSARGANIIAYGPKDSTFASLVKDATTTFETTKAANSVASALRSGGATAAAARLATVTRAAHNPDTALGIIQACKDQGTLGAIGNALGALATPTSTITVSGKGPVQSTGISQSSINEFNEIYADLSQSVNAATAINVPLQNLLDPEGHAPITLGGTGQSAANIIGQSIAANAPKNLNGSSVYGNAANNAISNGDGAGLTLATAVALKQDGNSGLASSLVEGAAQGLQGLKSKTDSAVGALGSTYAPLRQLESTWTPFMNHSQMAKAVNGYLKDHPNMVRQVNAEMTAISKDGDAIVEAESAWNTYGTQLGSITGNNGLEKAVTQSLPEDNAAAYAVSQSTRLNTAIAKTLFPVVGQPLSPKSAESLLTEIIRWPGYNNAASGLSALRRAISALNKNLRKDNTLLTGSKQTSGLGSEQVTLSLSAAGLVLTLYNGITAALSQKISFTNPGQDVKNFLQQGFQQQAYDVYTGLGFAKYSGEIYSILGKDANKGAFQLYDGFQPKSSFLKKFLGADADGLKNSIAFKSLGVLYYGVGTVSSIAQALQALSGPNANDVVAMLYLGQAAGNLGNAIKPFVEGLPQSVFDALPQSLTTALPGAGTAVDVGALAEDIAGVSSFVGLFATIGLIGYQVYQGSQRQNANIGENAQFLEQGLGLNPNLAHALAAPANSEPSLLPALEQYAKANDMTPGELLLKLNHFANLNRGYLSSINQFFFEASRMPPQSNGKFASMAPGDYGNSSSLAPMVIEGPNGRAETVPTPLPAESLSQLKYWVQVLFGNQVG